MTTASFSRTSRTSDVLGERYLSPAEVAAILGVTTRTVANMAARGQLRRIILSRRMTRYVASDVADLITEATNAERPAATPGARKDASSPRHEPA
jgi:predicted DNA-binding transcriptional regulator AlpA